MICVQKQYEVKIKMVQEKSLQLKMKFFLGYNMKIVIFGGGEWTWDEGWNKNLMRWSLLVGDE